MVRARTTILTRSARLAVMALLGLSLGACNALTRLSQVGDAPPLTTIQDPRVITGEAPAQLPMPAPVPIEHHANSLWRPGSRHFLKDQRATEVGDIVTVIIDIEDNAAIANSTSRSRNNSEDMGLSGFLGYETQLDQILPGGIDNENLVGADSASNSQGSGSVNRGEEINLRIAALVTQVLPNGNLVVAGRQEVRVNFEVRDLQVVGLIRPEDITSNNTIGFEQIAEARISYGGRGQLSDVQQPRYGQQIFDIVWPF